MAVVASIAINSHAVVPPPPPCYPGIPFTESSVANIPVQYVKGVLGDHVYWWCITKTETIVGWGDVCSYTGGDCNTTLLKTLQNIAKVKDKDKYNELIKNIINSSSYDCTASTFDFAWQQAVCKEHGDIYEANKTTWLNGIVITPIVNSKIVKQEDIFLYYGTTYSGVTGFKTTDECFRYAQTVPNQVSFTCVTRTQLGN